MRASTIVAHAEKDSATNAPPTHNQCHLAAGSPTYAYATDATSPHLPLCRRQSTTKRCGWGNTARLSSTPSLPWSPCWSTRRASSRNRRVLVTGCRTRKCLVVPAASWLLAPRLIYTTVANAAKRYAPNVPWRGNPFLLEVGIIPLECVINV